MPETPIQRLRDELHGSLSRHLSETGTHLECVESIRTFKAKKVQEDQLLWSPRIEYSLADLSGCSLGCTVMRQILQNEQGLLFSPQTSLDLHLEFTVGDD